MRKILSVFMALLLVCSIPLSALAIEVDVTCGDVTIGDTQVTHTDSTNTTKTEDHDGSVTVKGSTDENTITVNVNTEVTVTLDNVTVDNTNNAGEAGMKVTTGEEGKVTVELEGDNTLKGGYEAAGLQTSNNQGSLEITDTDNDGSLTAIGGKGINENQGGGAGIGGGAEEQGTNITISGGTITATGGSSQDANGYPEQGGAGIGGGYDGDGVNITVSGGAVIATGGERASGIGGGFKGDGTNITISDGAVTATGSYGGAAIGGGGSWLREGGAGTNITISGGVVNATGGPDGAGIGGGDCGDGKNITISGGEVTATGGEWGGAGIGGGWRGTGTDITISGGIVTAMGGDDAAGIGGGYSGDGENITISGGEVTATGSDGGAAIDGGNAAGIGGGYFGYGANITIEGYAQVDAIGRGFAANAGDGANFDTTEKVADNLTLALESDHYAPHSDDHGDRCGRYNDIYGCDGKEAPAEPEPEQQDSYLIYTVDTSRWEEDWDYEKGILTITALDSETNTVKEDAIFTTWGYGIDALMGYYKIKTVRFITANAERELDLAELAKLVRETGDEYDLIHKGSESTLMLNNVDVEEKLQK